MYCCLTNFFPIVDACVPQLRRYSPTKLCDGAQMAIIGDFLRPEFSVSRMHHVSDLHLKFALRPHHVWKYGRHSNLRRLRLGEEKKERRKQKKKPQGKNIMARPITQGVHNYFQTIASEFAQLYCPKLFFKMIHLTFSIGTQQVPCLSPYRKSNVNHSEGKFRTLQLSELTNSDAFENNLFRPITEGSFASKHHEDINSAFEATWYADEVLKMDMSSKWL